MLDKLPGVSVDFDPFSSDFRRIRIGPLRIDIDGGFSTMVRQVVQIAYGKRTSTTTGETYDVPRTELIGRVLTGKFSPTAGFVRDVLDEEDFVGNDLDSPQAYAKRVAELWTPLVAQDVFDATQEFGVIGLGTAPIGFLGGGLTTYGQGVDWTEDFKPYFAIPTDPKRGEPTRMEYREDNPEIDAKLFIVGGVSSLMSIKGHPVSSSSRSVLIALRLILDNNIDPDDIKGIRERKDKRAEEKEAGRGFTYDALDRLITLLEEANSVETTPSPQATPTTTMPAQPESLGGTTPEGFGKMLEKVLIARDANKTPEPVGAP
jgi:hypothetical protein